MPVDVPATARGGASIVPSNGHGALLAVVAFAIFSATDATMKVMASGLPAPQLTFVAAQPRSLHC
ncbi:hypothetical protein [Ensifer sp. 4252]|uniref:hypothetical protein n=1 Tax=Ensifer sp. 4252 TaxID=3373915 RepID=UPI003D2506C4